MNQTTLRGGKPRVASLKLFSEFGELLAEFGEFSAERGGLGFEFRHPVVFQPDGQRGRLKWRRAGGRGEGGYVDGTGEQVGVAGFLGAGQAGGV